MFVINYIFSILFYIYLYLYIYGDVLGQFGNLSYIYYPTLLVEIP